MGYVWYTYPWDAPLPTGSNGGHKKAGFDF